MLTLRDIYGIFRMIVAQYPYDKCGGLHTFATFDQRTDLDAENLNKSYRDYLDGTFWARRWYLGGANPNTLKKEYGILTLEHKVSELPDIFKPGQMVADLYLTVLQQVGYESCPEDCLKTDFQVDESNFLILQRVISEFITYSRFRITPPDGDPYDAFISQGNADDLSGKGYSLELLGGNPLAYMAGEPVKIYKSNFGVDRVRSATTMIRITVCDPEEFSFDYSSVDVKKLGTLTCC